MAEAQGEEGHREGHRRCRPDLCREHHPHAHRPHELAPALPHTPMSDIYFLPVVVSYCLLFYIIFMYGKCRLINYEENWWWLGCSGAYVIFFQALRDRVLKLTSLANAAVLMV